MPVTARLRLALAGLAALGALALPAAARAERVVGEQPAAGAAGAPVVLYGAGYQRHHRVVVSQAGRDIKTVRSDAHGRFVTSVRIPSRATRWVGLMVRDARGHAVSHYLVTTAPYAGKMNEVVAESGSRLRWAPTVARSPGFFVLSGSGYAPDAVVTLRWRRSTRHVRTDDRGDFSLALPIPAGAHRAQAGSVALGGEKLHFGIQVQRVSAPVGGSQVTPPPAVTLPPTGLPLPVVSPTPPGPNPTPTPTPPPPSAPDPVVAAAGDIACDPDTSNINQPLGASTCQEKWTAAIISKINPTAVLGLGDFQYEEGTLDKYSRSYDPTWGAFKSITYPTAGNGHDDFGSGGYVQYWGRDGTQPYSFDLGTWHIVSVPSGCVQGNTTVDCSAGGPIDTWLRNDMATHRNKCSLAFWHNPRWTTTTSYHGDFTQVAAYMNSFYAAGGDVVLSGDNHDYERFEPRNGAGASDPNGVTEFVVGTGGKYLMPFTATPPSTGAHIDNYFGVLKLTLHPSGFDYQFVNTAGSVKDSGTQACH